MTRPANLCYVVTLQLPGYPDVFALESVLNALAQANAAWFLDCWDCGLDPPTSALEGGVRYRPRGRSSSREFHGAPTVFRRREADCGPIAAITAGYLQARARSHGTKPEDAAQQYRVALDPQDPYQPKWHAIVVTPRERIDPTEGMVEECFSSSP